jgi:hypothetical protein
LSSRIWKTATLLGWVTAGLLVTTVLFVRDETPSVPEQYWAPFWAEITIFLVPAALLTGAVAASTGLRASKTRKERLVKISLASIPLLTVAGFASAAAIHVDLGGPYGKREFWILSLVCVCIPAALTVISWRPWRRLENDGHRLIRSSWTPALLIVYVAALLVISSDVSSLGGASCAPGTYTQLEGTLLFLADGLVLAVAIWSLMNLVRFRRRMWQAVLSFGMLLIALPAMPILFLIAILAIQGHNSC